MELLTETNDSEVLLFLMGLVVLLVLINKFIIRPLIDKDMKELQKKLPKDSSNKVRKKSEKMVEEGLACIIPGRASPHNWYERVETDQYGKKLEYLFCDLCKKKPSEV